MATTIKDVPVIPPSERARLKDPNRITMKDHLVRTRMRIVALLAASGMTQCADLAAAAGVTSKQLSRWIEDPRWPAIQADAEREIFTEVAEKIRDETFSPLARDHLIATRGRTLMAEAIDGLEKVVKGGGASASMYREAINAYRAAMDHSPDVIARKSKGGVNVDKAVIYMPTAEQSRVIAQAADEAGIGSVLEGEFEVVDEGATNPGGRSGGPADGGRATDEARGGDESPDRAVGERSGTVEGGEPAGVD